MEYKQSTNTKKFTTKDGSVGDSFVFINDKDDRIEKVEFHVKAQDYFGTMSTILKILAEDKEISHEHLDEVLEGISDDLDYLQNNYKITKK